MAVYLTFAAAALLIMLYPHLRIFVKRISLAVRMRRFCRAYGVTMATTNPLWFLAPIGHGYPVVYLETTEHVWAVALFAVPKRRSTLILGRDDWRLETYMRLWGGGWAGYKFHSRSHKRPAVRFIDGLPDRMLLKHFTAVMLVNPGCLGMRTVIDGRSAELGNGEVFAGAVWCAFGRLRDMITYALEREAGRSE